MTLTADEDGDIDEQEDEAMSHHYQPTSGVKELERRTKRWDITNISYSDSWQRDNVENAMHFTHEPTADDQWTLSRSLRQEYESEGKRAVRLVVREEVWVGMRRGL